jgi:hypothetical protein
MKEVNANVFVDNLLIDSFIKENYLICKSFICTLYCLNIEKHKSDKR